MAKRAYCDCCGNEIIKQLPITIDSVMIEMENGRSKEFCVRHTSGTESDDVCATCVRRAFASKLTAAELGVLLQRALTSPADTAKAVEQARPAFEPEDFGASSQFQGPDAQMRACWERANENLHRRGLPPIDFPMFSAIAGALPRGVNVEGGEKILRREATSEMLSAGFVLTHRDVPRSLFVQRMWEAMFDAA